MASDNQKTREYEDLVHRINAEVSSKVGEIFDSFLAERVDDGLVSGAATTEVLDAVQAAMTLALTKFMVINAVATQEGSFGKHTKEDELLKLLGILTYQASDFIYGFLHGKEEWPVVKTVKYN